MNKDFELSLFGENFTRRTGILELMDDMGKALADSDDYFMLGGGNPASLPVMNELWRDQMEALLKQEDAFEQTVANYASHRGNPGFLEAVAELLNTEYGWPVTEKNIAVTNGSQSAAFFLINLFSGQFANGKSKKILFPLAPEYVGYADQALCPGCFSSVKPTITETGEHSFKYHVNFDELDITDETGALWLSRPTNPTGNVVTDEEISRLAALAENRHIPLFIDNAYGQPFPGIIFRDVTPAWNENIVLSMSLSKLGLPSTRTGIIVAREQIAQAVASVNAITSLANTNLGQVLTEKIIRNREILRVSREVITPYYKRRSEGAIKKLNSCFGGKFEYSVHENEGTFFLWVWFKNLPITTYELYQRLKKRKVIVVAGRYFFFGIDGPWPHSDQCIRINYSQDETAVNRGLEIIAEEIEKLF
jgi:valine--pyruvate aminotransferase